MGPEHACSGPSLFALRTSIQTWFGHSNCSFTVNTYVHSSKDSHVQMAQSFADKLPKLLPASVEAMTFECLPEDGIVVR